MEDKKNLKQKINDYLDRHCSIKYGRLIFFYGSIWVIAVAIFVTFCMLLFGCSFIYERDVSGTSNINEKQSTEAEADINPPKSWLYRLFS